MGLPHDHPSVDTVRATLQRHGSGIRVAVPGGDRDLFPDGEVVRVVVDGSDRHAVVESGFSGGDLFLPGIYDSPALARDPGDAVDRLGEWADRNDRSAGASVLLDVLDEGFRYGLRAPGESVTYRDRSSPDDGLASIASDLDDRS